MKTYIYTLKLAERLWDDTSWTDKDKTIVTAHFNRLQDDFNKGIVLHAGRTDKTDTDGFGIVIFKAENRADAEKYMLEDPAVKEGIMKAKCQLYRVALG